MKPSFSVWMLALALAAAPRAPVAAPAPAGADTPPWEQAGPRPRLPRPPHALPRAQPESFTEETVRRMADGRVFRRQVEQVASGGSFRRKEVMTNPDGKTATRTLTATLDKDRQVWHRQVEGRDFDGTVWTRRRDVPLRQGPEPRADGPDHPAE